MGGWLGRGGEGEGSVIFGLKCAFSCFLYLLTHSLCDHRRGASYGLAELDTHFHACFELQPLLRLIFYITGWSSLRLPVPWRCATQSSSTFLDDRSGELGGGGGISLSQQNVFYVNDSGEKEGVVLVRPASR